jgi:acyl carrier protein
MNNVHERLTQCFLTVFPSIPPSQIPAADIKTVAGWDSIAAQNLLCVIEEEFEIMVMPEDIAELRSFAAIEEYLSTRA